jgi:hypothetical protein
MRLTTLITVIVNSLPVWPTPPEEAMSLDGPAAVLERAERGDIDDIDLRSG